MILPVSSPDVITPEQTAARIFSSPEAPIAWNIPSKEYALKHYGIGYLGLLDGQNKAVKEEIFRCYPVVNHYPVGLYGGQVIVLWENGQIKIVDKDDEQKIFVDPNEAADLGVEQFQILVKDSIRNDVDGSYDNFTSSKQVTLFPPAEGSKEWEVCEDVGIALRKKITPIPELETGNGITITEKTVTKKESPIREWMREVAQENTKCLWTITAGLVGILGLRALLKRIM